MTTINKSSIIKQNMEMLQKMRSEGKSYQDLCNYIKLNTGISIHVGQMHACLKAPRVYSEYKQVLRRLTHIYINPEKLALLNDQGYLRHDKYMLHVEHASCCKEMVKLYKKNSKLTETFSICPFCGVKK